MKFRILIEETNKGVKYYPQVKVNFFSSWKYLLEECWLNKISVFNYKFYFLKTEKEAIELIDLFKKQEKEKFKIIKIKNL